jgi:hypothetical protein
VTSFEKIGSELLLATSTSANLGADDATPIDTGNRDLSVLPVSQVLANKPPVSFVVKGEHVMEGHWGGIPIDGYRSAELQVDASRENRMKVAEYSLALPVPEARHDSHQIVEGRQSISLEGYHGVVSFQLEHPDPLALFSIRLS